MANFSQTAIKVLLPTLLMPFLFGGECFAALEQTIEKSVLAEIEKAKIVDSAYKIYAKVGANEATVSTYGHKESKDKEKDCKIDATLMAKAIMLNNDLGIVRLAVRFYEPSGTGDGREVIITKAEVKALASGAISQDEFLSSLRCSDVKNTAQTESGVEATSIKETGDETASAAPGISTSKTSETKADSTLKVASASPKDEVKEAPKKTIEKARYKSEKYGFSFELPNSWNVDDEVTHKDGRLLCIQSLNAKYENNIELYYKGGKPKMGPLQFAQEQRVLFNYKGCKFERYEQAKIGRGGYPGALVVLTYPHSSGEDYYEMHCYFGKIGAIFDLRGWCPKSDYRVVAPAFWQVMNSIMLPTSATAAAANPSTSKAPARKK